MNTSRPPVDPGMAILLREMREQVDALKSSNERNTDELRFIIERMERLSGRPKKLTQKDPK